MRQQRAAFRVFACCAHAAPDADICPVYEGMLVSPGARRIELGGSDIDVHLQQLLKARCVEGAACSFVRGR